MTQHTTETFIIKDETGFHTYTGEVLARDQHTIVLALIEPYRHLRHVVQIEVEQIVCEQPAA